MDSSAGLTREDLIRALWPVGERAAIKTWAILDGARDKRIYEAICQSFEVKCCLFAGELSPELSRVAPYLIQLEPEDRLTKLLLDQGWGNSWGIYLRSDASLETLRRHFRSFLRVSDEAGRKLLFRYYDPRVLRVFLPTCVTEQ